MRILLLTSNLHVGGIERYTVTLANALQQMGHSVFVASAGGELGKQLLPEIKAVKIPLGTKSIASPKITATVFKLRELVKEEKIEIIHAQTRVAQFAACMLSGATKVPYVATWHGFYKPHFFRKLLPCWGEKTIAISMSVVDHLKNDFNRDEKKIRLIHNGLDLSRFEHVYTAQEKLEIRKRYGLKEGLVVGIIARLSEEKGHLILLDAFKGLLDDIRDAQLLIVGGGRIEDKIKARVSELGIEGNVRFVGNTLDTHDLLSVMDVFARPSTSEGFGLTIVEAMLMGVPVVSSNVGDFKEMNKDAGIGILVDPLDSRDLRKAIKKVLTDREFAVKISAAAKKYAETHFSADKMARQVEKVYREVIDGSK
ncbi:MAG: glycosyltransferase family 4 protein [Candidatus Omnitrophica bacterium]|nr:glycosyltransferase family 4 protein [Candidatus Omnitrophota bacterium]MDD5310827.1 glycosyltransferase family 4 protein [Candidatus Omnitrophota bacterium]MDD5546788.1 glycosyltransferase family 4 protein [Candidatus Omnitrophota bacterium]